MTQITSEEALQLRKFHALHFTNKPVPDISTDDALPADAQTYTLPDENDLGYYADGVRRTLTTGQIKMFRHSEIQRLLLERQQTRELAEKEARKKARRQERDAAQRRHFDDMPDRNAVDELVYDDAQPPETRDGQPAGEKKFLWPQLGT